MGMDDHFDTSGVFKISKFEISKFACSKNYTKTTALERSVASKLPGGLRILHCAQTFTLDLGAIPSTRNN